MKVLRGWVKAQISIQSKNLWRDLKRGPYSPKQPDRAWAVLQDRMRKNCGLQMSQPDWGRSTQTVTVSAAKGASSKYWPGGRNTSVNTHPTHFQLIGICLLKSRHEKCSFANCQTSKIISRHQRSLCIVMSEYNNFVHDCCQLAWTRTCKLCLFQLI